DTVQWQRTIALTPRRVQRTWLYAAIPVNITSNEIWRIDVVDDKSGQLLATQNVAINELIPAHEGMLGVTSAAGLGLAPYSQSVTQHERVRFLRGLNPSELPDRWHGFSPLSALIWTPDAIDPSSP